MFPLRQLPVLPPDLTTHHLGSCAFTHTCLERVPWSTLVQTPPVLSCQALPHTHLLHEASRKPLRAYTYFSLAKPPWALSQHRDVDWGACRLLVKSVNHMANLGKLNTWHVLQPSTCIPRCISQETLAHTSQETGTKLLLLQEQTSENHQNVCWQNG